MTSDARDGEARGAGDGDLETPVTGDNGADDRTDDALGSSGVGRADDEVDATDVDDGALASDPAAPATVDDADPDDAAATVDDADPVDDAASVDTADSVDAAATEDDAPRSAERDDADSRDDPDARDEPLVPAADPIRDHCRRDDRAGSARAAGEPRRAPIARVLAGVAGIALAAATVWAVEALPLPQLRAQAPQEVMSPVPGDQLRVCPGPLTLLGQSSADPTRPGYKGYAELSQAGSLADLTIEGLAPAVTTAAPPAAPTNTASGVPAVLSEPGIVGDRATRLVGTQSVAVAAPGAAGFAATPCRQPSADSWLVGGSTAGGSSTMLALANPTERTAVVRVALYGQEGPLAAPGLDGIEVPAGTQIAVPLEGVAPEQAGFVVHLSTRGSAIAGSLHEVSLDGLQAGGIEIVSPVIAPSTRFDVIGVPFINPTTDTDTDHFAARESMVRLYAPGSTGTTATVTLRDASGTELEPVEVNLEAGRVIDVPLGFAPAGRYSVTVESEAPVVGAVRSSLATGDVDFGWYLPSPPLDGVADVAVAPGPQPRLQLATTGDETVTVSLVAPDGAVTPITIRPGETVSRDVTAGAYHLEGMQGVAAAVTYDGAGQMSGVPVMPGSPLAADVTVYR